MGRLRDRRSALIALYAGLVLLGHAVHALPGLPEFRSTGEHIFWLAVDILFVALIARGSRGAIAVALTLDCAALALVVGALAGMPESAVTVFFATVALRAVVLYLLWRETSPRRLYRDPVGEPAA